MLERSNNRRNGYIELCRFIFAVCIFSHHMLNVDNHGKIFFIGGYIGTDFFYILTGFFLYAAALKEQIGDSAIGQAVKRIKKVYPYFIVTWIIAFVIAHISAKAGLLLVFWNFLQRIPELLLLSMSGMGSGGNNYDFVGTGWFLSALLIGVLFLYPIIKKYKDKFASSFAPLIAIIIYGYFMKSIGNIGAVNQNFGLVQEGLLRATAGLSLGCFLNYVSSYLTKIEITQLGDWVMSIFQIVLILVSLFLMEKYDGSNDSIQIVLFSLIILFSFSFNTKLNDFCSNKLCYALGKYSLLIYITQCLTYMYPFPTYPQDWKLSYILHFVYVILASFLVSCIVDFFKWFKLGKIIRSILFKEKQEVSEEK